MMSARSKKRALFEDNNNLLMRDMNNENVTYNEYTGDTYIRHRALLMCGIFLTKESITVKNAIKCYPFNDLVKKYIIGKDENDFIYVVHYSAHGTDNTETFIYNENEQAFDKYNSMLTNIIQSLELKIRNNNNRYYLGFYDNNYQMNMMVISEKLNKHVLYFEFPQEQFIIREKQTFSNFDNAIVRMMELGNEVINNINIEHKNYLEI